METHPNDDERNAVDLITQAMYSVSFLRGITDQIFSPQRNVVVSDYYENWIKHTGSKKPLIPFSPGIIMALFYVGILFAKERWFDLLPDKDSYQVDEEWGFRGVVVNAPENSNPSVKYVVRRLRNALGHGTPAFRIDDRATRENMLDLTTIHFHDVNMRKPSDTFDATLTLNQIITLIKKFQSVIHKTVRDK